MSRLDPARRADDLDLAELQMHAESVPDLVRMPGRLGLALRSSRQP